MSGIAVPNALELRRDASTQRLSAVRQGAQNFGLADHYPTVVVYATGSIGRNEAGTHSDLDIFCVDVAQPPDEPVGNLASITLFSSLIAINESNRFPEFSNDGEFLVLHPMDHLLEFLGSRDDDYRNLFTARMLLLLESQVLSGESAYAKAVDRVIDLYWRDCSEPEAFRPTFLINDLVRYWKTLCLAHEWKLQKEQLARDIAKQKARVAVLKLQFNRIWMVFNGLAYLLFGFEGEGLPREHVKRLVELSPLERAMEMAAGDPEAQASLQAILDEYAWFLEQTDRPKSDVQAFFAEDSNYKEGRKRGERFGDQMAALVEHMADQTPIQRYLLV